jgi:hypothetical protein
MAFLDFKVFQIFPVSVQQSKGGACSQQRLNSTFVSQGEGAPARSGIRRLLDDPTPDDPPEPPTEPPEPPDEPPTWPPDPPKVPEDPPEPPESRLLQLLALTDFQ